MVIDATNTTRHRRAGWLRIVRDLGVSAEAFVVDTPLEECLRRNLSCRHRVPEEVMERMARWFESVTTEEIPTVRKIANGTMGEA